MNVKTLLLALPRKQKRLLQVATDILLIWLALWLAFFIRLGADQLINPLGDHWWLFATAPLTALPFFVTMGLYRAVMRYIGRDALITIVQATALSALLLTLLVYWYRGDVLVPRSVVFIYWLLATAFVGGLRLFMRRYFVTDTPLFYPLTRFRKHQNIMDKRTPVAIYGAGDAGFQLLSALERSSELLPLAFIDDDRSLAGRVIAGLRVYTPKHIEQLISETGCQEVLLALPSATRQRRREIIEQLEPYPVHVRTLPDINEIATGKVKVDDIREVGIEDVLGRDQVTPDVTLLQHCIEAKVVMVTGAGGSIGSELCRKIIEIAPTTLVLYEHSEFNLYQIHRELESIVDSLEGAIQLVPILGSVRNPKRLVAVLQRYSVATVYHAAAYKHVPIVEHNVAEGIENNVQGTVHAALSSIIAGVESFVLISTDKAVRPTNVMGGSKRLAEMALQALATTAQVTLSQPELYGVESSEFTNKTRFTMVRFGNVLGSSGSVIPLFRQQIANGGPVTVTHPNITRYFMTIPEAAQLVIQAGSMGEGGDVFVLDMGEPIKIADLAVKMIHIAGLSLRDETNPEGDIAVEYSGLRPGEKLYEELLIGDAVGSTSHPMIMRAEEEFISWERFDELLNQLSRALEEGDFVSVRALMVKHVAGFKPDSSIVDWMARV
ncbi:polysaccharide biosynthesis protein [Aestuariirhabdus sp. Z084]|uniref:polysaccharide biosynthesis protein n=1 Tax=Aestuariirhabdus haliotis TaxID=2918751 RepID=UPI0020C0E20E|nr:nucleoside-diphosphate sugar epimerase/dehydratase [Aestuariirhabdus haliotis]MCL6415812.1 polysaccharide biosynthesis protein [Aestuariirhabdus haliotis]